MHEISIRVSLHINPGAVVIKCTNCSLVTNSQRSFNDLEKWHAISQIIGFAPNSKGQLNPVVEPAVACPKCFHDLGLDQKIIMPKTELPKDFDGKVTKKDLNE